jgi:hypothetical protein
LDSFDGFPFPYSVGNLSKHDISRSGNDGVNEGKLTEHLETRDIVAFGTTKQDKGTGILLLNRPGECERCDALLEKA